jgi:hypothetical protein
MSENQSDAEKQYLTYQQAAALYHQGTPERSVISTIKAAGYNEDEAQQMFVDIMAGKKPKRVRTSGEVSVARRKALSLILTGLIYWGLAALLFAFWLNAKDQTDSTFLRLIVTAAPIIAFGLGGQKVAVGIMNFVMGWEQLPSRKTIDTKLRRW